MTPDSGAPASRNYVNTLVGAIEAGSGVTATQLRDSLDANKRPVVPWRWRVMEYSKNGGLATVGVSNLAAPTVTAGTNGDSTDYPWLTLTTTTARGNVASVASSAAADSGTFRAWPIVGAWLVKTGNHSVDSLRAVIGFVSHRTANQASSAGIVCRATFEYDFGSGQASGVRYWKCFSNVNRARFTGLDSTTTTVAYTPGTIYRLSVRIDATAAYFWIDDALVATHSTNKPPSSIPLTHNASISNGPSIQQRIIRISRAVFTHAN